MVLLNLYIRLESRFSFGFFLNQHISLFICLSQFEGFLFVCLFWHCLNKLSYLIQFSNIPVCFKYRDGKPRIKVFRNLSKLVTVIKIWLQVLESQSLEAGQENRKERCSQAKAHHCPRPRKRLRKGQPITKSRNCSVLWIVGSETQMEELH